MNCFVPTTLRLRRVFFCGALKTSKAFESMSQVHEFSHVIAQQNAIGWRQIFQGRFGKAWSDMQEQHYRGLHRRQQRKTFTGDQWQVSIILWVWDKWYTLWKQRNQEAHGHDAQLRAASLQKELNRRLALVYRQRQDYESEIQDLLLDSEEEHRRQQAPTVLQNWLATNEQVFRDSARRLRTRIRQGFQSILPFLTRR